MDVLGCIREGLHPVGASLHNIIGWRLQVTAVIRIWAGCIAGKAPVKPDIGNAVAAIQEIGHSHCGTAGEKPVVISLDQGQGKKSEDDIMNISCGF